jgi:hypothetical protein
VKPQVAPINPAKPVPAAAKPAKQPVAPAEPAKPQTALVAAEKPAPAPPTKPAVTVPAVSSHKKPSTSGADSYVSSGVVILDSTETMVQPKVKPALLALQTRFQQRIALACAKPTKEVAVVAQSEKSLHVRVKARSTKEAEELSSKVFQLPELEPFEVSLDILVGP